MPKELTGIAAFAPIAIADAFDAARDPILNLYHRPNDPSVTFQIKSADIVKLIPGGEEDGCRLLQLILRTGSIVETKVEMLRSVRNLQDPTLKHLTAAAISTHSSLPST